MKKINIIKITLDTLMTFVFVLLYNKMVIAGLTFHEVAGLAIGAVFIIHMALNWRWIRQVTTNLFSKNVKAKTKLGYVVDILLLICMAYIIISGIMISKVVFANLKLGNSMIFKVTHMSVSYIALLLIGIHLGLHWNWVMKTFKKMFRINGTNKARSIVAKALAVIILAAGIYSIYSTGYINRLSSVVNVVSIGQGQLPANDMKGRPNTDGRSRVEGRSNSDRNSQKIQGDGLQVDRKQIPEGGKGKANTNPLNVILTNLGIISVFAMFTYYLEKLLLLFKPKEIVARVI